MNAELTHWFILFLLISATASGQNAVKTQAQVESHIAHERYCTVGSRSAILLITFDARIRNTSDSPIELTLPLYPVARVSHNLNDLKHRKYEAILRIPLLIEHTKDANSDLSSPTEIEPGNTQQFQTMEITFPLSLRAETSHTDLGFGTHFVEMEFELRDVMTRHFVKRESQPIHPEIKNIVSLRACK